MSNQSAVEKMADRIAAVDWQPDEAKTDSYRVLAILLLRRCFVWLDAVGLSLDTAPFRTHSDVLDVIKVIDVPYEVPHEHIARIEKHLSTHLKKRGGLELLQKCLLHAVCWEAMRDHPKITGMNLPAPYEPAVQLYERGGDLFWGEFGYYVTPMVVAIGRKRPDIFLNNVRDIDIENHPYVLDIADETDSVFGSTFFNEISNISNQNSEP
jgi:hypothetical protein